MGHCFGATVAVVAVESPDSRPASISPSGRIVLFRALQTAAASAQISLARLHPVDRIDGISLLVDGNIPPETIAGPLVTNWDSALAQADSVIRCRIGIHQGLVTVTGDERSGEAVTTAERIVDAPQLHDALAASPRARLALIISDAFYRAVVKPGPRELDPSTFVRVTTATKNAQRDRAWIHVVGYPAPLGLAQDSDQGLARETATVESSHAGAGQSGGISITGNVHGDVIGRDKIVWPHGDAPPHFGSPG